MNGSDSPYARMLLPALASAAVLLHVSIEVFAGYGMFRDEFYYIACSKRLAFGYVDHPPLSVWVLALWRQIAGESQFSIALLAALFSGAGVWAAGVLTRRLGGGNSAMLSACLLFLLAPISLAMGSFWSMNVLDALFWLLAARVALDALDSGSARHWLLLGALAGLGCMNKISMAWFCLGVVAALVSGDARAQLRTPWPWVAAGVTLLLFLPFVLWNAAHDFAHLEFIRNASAMKYGGISRTDFLGGALLIHNPLAAIALLGGLYWTVFGDGRRFRAIGSIWLCTLLILLVNGHSKPEYISAATGLLFAAGGVWLEQWRIRRASLWRRGYLLMVCATSMLLAPFAAPMLPVDTFIAWNRAIAPPVKNAEGHAMGDLPQFFADMHGWEEMAAAVSGAYLSLPYAERDSVVVLAQNYGQAAALEYYAKRYPLPPVICMHNNYWLWGYPQGIASVIVIGGRKQDHARACAEVSALGRHSHRHAMPYESNLTIWHCRGVRIPFAEIWKREKRYI